MFVSNSFSAEHLISPKAVLTTSATRLLVEKNGGWSAKSNVPIDPLLEAQPPNQFRLSDRDLNIVKMCFRGVNCQTKLALADVVQLGRVDLRLQSKRGDLVFKRLSEDVLVSYWPANQNQILIISISNGEIFRGVKNAIATTIDPIKQDIFSAICETSSYECNLNVQKFGETRGSVIAKLNFRVVDLYFNGRILYALAKVPSANKSFSSPALVAAGHGRYYENWYVLEVSISTGQIQSFPIADELKNGGAYFLEKWKESEAWSRSTLGTSEVNHEDCATTTQAGVSLGKR
jgi:hypothetical protein